MTNLQNRAEHSRWHCKEEKNVLNPPTHQYVNPYFVGHLELKNQEKHERQSRKHNVATRYATMNLQNRIEQLESHCKQ